MGTDVVVVVTLERCLTSRPSQNIRYDSRGRAADPPLKCRTGRGNSCSHRSPSGVVRRT